MKKRKGNVIRLIALVLFLIEIVFVGSGCVNDQGTDITLYFMYAGQSTAIEQAYLDLIDEFNNTRGKELGISVEAQPKPYSSYDTVVSNFLIGKSGPDIVMFNDETFKMNCSFLEPLDSYMSGSDVLDGIYRNLTERLYYNTQTSSTTEDASLYGIPVFNNTTVLYVNTTKLSNANIKIISVPESKMTAWNNGEIADTNGNKKSDLNITIDVPSKGFYREKPYVDGGKWYKPTTSELMIFNDQIAMNWDELEDLGRIMTKTSTLNPNSPTDYGFYTEWWFPYTWTVGGDCLIDMEDAGGYAFGIPEDYPNYIVTSGTYIGEYTGKVYKVGETLDFLDKIDVAKNKTIKAEDDGTFTIDGSLATIRTTVAAEAADAEGCLKELPSTKEAFVRFAKLAANEYESTRISPYPSVFSSTNSISYFTSEKLAMIIERVSNLDFVKKNLGSENFTIAPLPVYKEYTTPTDASCDEIIVQGLSSGHSHLSSLTIRKNSPVKEQAYEFIAWAATTGQQVFARAGYGTVNATYESIVLSNTNLINTPSALLNSTKTSRIGDWGYLKDRYWIDGWAIPLNGKVRNGTEKLSDFFVNYVKSTNAALAGY